MWECQGGRCRRSHPRSVATRALGTGDMQLLMHNLLTNYCSPLVQLDGHTATSSCNGLPKTHLHASCTPPCRSQARTVRSTPPAAQHQLQ